MHIKTIKSPEEIACCSDAFLELRPHLTERHNFVDQVLTQQKEGYEIAATISFSSTIAAIS